MSGEIEITLKLKIRRRWLNALKIAGRVLLGAVLALVFLVAIAAIWFMWAVGEATNTTIGWHEIGFYWAMLMTISGVLFYFAFSSTKAAVGLWR
jgi:hypothetical protein